MKKEKAKPKTADYDLCGVKSWEKSKDGILQKERKDDTEQLERSSITEEHELAQNPTYSSDSTQNSNKRKRHASTSDGTHAQGASPGSDGAHVQVASALKGTCVQGNILRIRLPSQKNMKCEINEEQLSTASIRRGEIPKKIVPRTEQNKTCSASAATPSTSQVLPPRLLNNELRQSQIPLSSREDMCSSSGHVSKEFKKRQRLLHKYTDLIENFIPPIQHLGSTDANDDDQDWLFGRKHEQEPMQLDKIGTVDSQISCYSSCSMWPLARHLPDADIYALPYTIPF